MERKRYGVVLLALGVVVLVLSAFAGQIGIGADDPIGWKQVVGIGSQRLTDEATLAHAVFLVRRNWSSSMRRPREIRDITVPIGTSSVRAISAYENSSTSRNHTA